MHKVKDLMRLDKLTLQTEEWCWGNVLQFTHEEVQPHPYSDETVDTEISVDEAKELIKHLQNFIDSENCRGC